MTYSIYRITIHETGKSYIGQSKDIEERWKNHRYDAMRDPALSSASRKCAIHNALAKYGCDNATWQVIDECETVKEANELEEGYIERLNTLAPNGYNLHPGGRNHTPSQETKDKISEKLKVVGFFNGKKGADHPLFGTHQSEERKRAQSEKLSGDRCAVKKISSAIARQIYLDYLEHESWTTSDLAERYPLKRGAILNILNKRCWKKATADLPGVDSRDRARGEKWVLAKINQTTADEIRVKYATGQYTQRVLGEMYGVGITLVSNIVNGKAWTKTTPTS